MSNFDRLTQAGLINGEVNGSLVNRLNALSGTVMDHLLGQKGNPLATQSRSSLTAFFMF